MSIPGKWIQEQARIDAIVGDLCVQRQVLREQLAEVERRYDGAVKAAVSLRVTGALAAEVEAGAAEAPVVERSTAPPSLELVPNGTGPPVSPEATDSP